jgi:hypothetical protein
MATNDILWAGEQLKLGNNVRRVEWPAGDYVEKPSAGSSLEIYLADDDYTTEFVPTLEDLTGLDWEIHVEQEESDPQDEDAEE